ncbi:Fosmidomycin resistance protein [Paenibacillus swuensis]|uniref:Fosmidomycin resistance protein n=2 Tax=Paenibacillus swuensis TaxID=1178515 RepID=A0A172TNQ4_9BACL|nr:Fosmidomycin resistance protein [Paenibacillus swuensis]
MFTILFAISFVHLMNDMIQGVVPAMYPILQQSLKLSLSQIGFIGFTFNVTSSLLQPLIGAYTDKRPMPYILPIGTLFSMAGVVGLAYASSYEMILLFVAIIGIGSAIMHPESSRVAHMAAGPRRGMAQSIFQVGGNAGHAFAPLIAAFILVPLGIRGAVWFGFAAAIAFVLQTYVAKWYASSLDRRIKKAKASGNGEGLVRSRKALIFSMGLLVLLLFSKNIYLAGMSNYYSFYLIDRFQLSIENAQYFVFVLLASGAIGVFIGGPLADRFGRKNMILFSILAPAPITIALPYLNLVGATLCTIAIGLILYSAFSIIVVYAQELMPGKVGLVSGLFFGLSFGLGGIGAALLGNLADATSIEYMFKVTSYLPLLGLAAVFLPSDRKKGTVAA